ncbi:MAG: acyl carrier protein [Acidobacteria bacterium]|nr:acyl carrier protein [Acidobacteriota bacterium]
MEREEIAARVRAIIHEQKTLDDDALDKADTLADVGIDSLDAINILYEIEDDFGMTVRDEDSKDIKSFDDLVNVVQAGLNRGSAG